MASSAASSASKQPKAKVRSKQPPLQTPPPPPSSAAKICISRDTCNTPCVLPTADASTASSFVTRRHTADAEVCRKRTFVANADSVTFEASNSNPRALGVGAICRFAVGALGVDATGASILVLTPDCSVVSVDVRVNALEKAAAVSAAASEEGRPAYHDARKMLSETFGTKKKKQEIRASETNMIDFASVKDDADVMKVAIAAAANRNAADAAQAPIAGEFDCAHGKPLPPYDVAAPTPEQAFDWSAVMPDAAFADVCAPTTAEEAAAFERMRDVPCLAPKLDAIESLDAAMLRSVVMLHALVKFAMLVQRNRVIAQHAEATIPHASVYAFIASSYADRKTGDRLEISNFNYDYLICAICLLFLRINGFETRINSLAKDMKMPTNKLVNYCRSFGCKFVSVDGAMTAATIGRESTEESSKIAKLSTPLIFPSIKKGSRRL